MKSMWLHHKMQPEHDPSSLNLRIFWKHWHLSSNQVLFLKQDRDLLLMNDNNTQGNVPQFVVTVDGDIHGQDTPENREIVKRIHACVNACDGISTEELERGVIQDMQRVIALVAPLLEQSVEEQNVAELPMVDAPETSVKAPIMINSDHAVRRSFDNV